MANRIVWTPSSDENAASYDIEIAASLSGSWSLLANVAHDLGGADYDANAGEFFYLDGVSPAASWYRVTVIDAVGQRSSPSTPFQALGFGTFAFASLADLKAYLSITSTADDATLTRLLLAASSWFESQVGRTLGLANHTEVQDGNGSRVIVPRHYPVASVASVEVNGETIPQAPDAVSNGWTLVGNVIHLRGYRATAGTANVSIAYEAGFAVIPPDVQQAVIEVAADRFQYRKRVGEVSKSLGGESVSFVSFQVPFAVQTVLDAYRRSSF